MIVGDQPPPPPPPPGIDEESIRLHLSSQKWPTGLAIALMRGLTMTPARFFICDDSGSMMSSDSHRVIDTAPGNNFKVVDCTRWAELTDTLKFHINLANKAQAPTEFRMLNGAFPISIGSSVAADMTGVPRMMSLLEASPGGGTPLCSQVNEVIAKVTEIAPQLRGAGKKAAVIICSDGEASDGNICEILKQFDTLPVWVVIRLCTDVKEVVDYWNTVDNQIELNMDIIDDQFGEAREINRLNNWLTYGEPLHRLREFG
eukprot:CAMPEP_0119044152 /NCGR_PEP_ID=MMETSP1177-20130426/29073_1 /TAXON_ID=2985 /ORGANISM="Ochromonas sp, Strain CCMP1899" /LENGTH=258 /DNA_ID=CAMNT_0007013745 /DNA_START=18 /DNA_END=791 /DNA_ORIENTATION=+